LGVRDENKINGVKPNVVPLRVFGTVVQSSDVGDSEDIRILDVHGTDPDPRPPSRRPALPR